MKATLFFVLIIFSTYSFAQLAETEGKKKKRDRKKKELVSGLLYEKDVRFGGVLKGNGWGLFVEKSTYPKYKIRKSFRLQLNETNHVKEIKQASNFNAAFLESSPKAYYYGKQNNLFNISLNYGKAKMISEKPKQKGIEVWTKYSLGPTLGIVKPYYLNLFYGDDVQKTESYSSENEELYLNKFAIIGSGGFFNGFDKLNYVGGVNAKYGLLFDWAVRENIVSTLEVGAMVDIYFKDIPLIIEVENGKAKNQFIFPTLYLSLQVGKKKTR